MFCYNCGAKLEDDEKFCYNCGAPVRSRGAKPAGEPAKKPAEPVKNMMQKAADAVTGAAGAVTGAAGRLFRKPDTANNPAARENVDRRSPFRPAASGAVKKASDVLESANERVKIRFDENKPAASAPGTASVSYGPQMPAEENQFSFRGSYVEYFEKVFREAFPEYAIEKHEQQVSRVSSTMIFTFRKQIFTKLVVELMSENCSSGKMQRDCRAAGIPYLRFYYDHEGWWNTKSYVIGRAKAALEG